MTEQNPTPAAMRAERPAWLNQWLDYPHGPLTEAQAREVCWYVAQLEHEHRLSQIDNDRISAQADALLRNLEAVAEKLSVVQDAARKLAEALRGVCSQGTLEQRQDSRIALENYRKVTGQ